ncbi:efflux transporter outer membrane subunit [Paenalcaligenes niemegkensis]|uniref:efflux transporter outer membrane subunit n=1 Tax=Paenalcaligenes niemegkensis TaxID=2895469 RepID=UPI001EE88051|nr:efflux transporter outer membrane subunit [Paenalcaligenes niemegkensis]MCQ9615520.1 efflux transporter outer membrane subunit [Paenalcaligenes niemegkensis]
MSSGYCRPGWGASCFFPTLDADAGATRGGSGTTSPATTYNLGLSAGWEPDVWGRVRRSNEAAEANVEASQADFAATRLSLESTLAKTYFQAKNGYASQQLLDETIRTYEQVLAITENRLAVGMAAQSDVAAARAQLENTRTQRLALNRQQAQLHNALAVLVGLPPAELQALALDGWPTLPKVPSTLPAQLLERRPDVASAERRAMAANAQIGVARAAWFPNLNLSAQGGYRAGEWAQWLSAPARFWSLGPSLALRIFDGGARTAQVNEAIASYDLQANGYKQAVLVALREVEDSLAQWYGIAAETVTQDRALAAARESLQLMRNQYEAGLVDFLSLAQVATTTLNAERSAISLLSEQYIAAVSLITGLGADGMPRPDWRPRTRPNDPLRTV